MIRTLKKLNFDEQKYEEISSQSPRILTHITELKPFLNDKKDIDRGDDTQRNPRHTILATYCSTFQPTSNKKQDTLLHRLLTHIIRGEQDSAEAIFKKYHKKYPGLLQLSGRVKAYMGETYEVTALQLALGAKDVEMAEMIRGYLRLLPNSEEEEQTQIEGLNLKVKQKKDETDFMALDTVLEAVIHADSEVDCAPAIKAFHSYLDLDAIRARADDDGVIRRGWHFNDRLLLRAFERYSNLFEKFSDRDDNWRNIICWRQVIGYIQRHLPACYAQAFYQGVYHLVERCPAKLNRRMPRLLQHNIYNSFYCDYYNPTLRLGYDYAWQASLFGASYVPPKQNRNTIEIFYRQFCEKKTAELQQFIQNSDRSRRCVMM